jgi:N-terminal domain of anti-restriction factor ArdC
MEERAVRHIEPAPISATSTEHPVFDLQNDRQRQVLQLLEQGTEALLTNDAYQAYLTTMSRFHRYSFANSLLIHAQNPEATRVAGYQAWRSLGRQVRKGERAIKIFVPFKKKLEDPGTGEADERVVGFGIGHVFDVSSTDGEPLPERPPLIEATEVTEVSRDVNRRLSRFLIGEGLLLETKELHGSAHGFWNPQKRQIVLRQSEVFDPLNVQRTKTLAHEAAHYLADHKSGVDRQDAEVVAESSAFVALAHFGLHTENYTFGYVAAWAGDMARIRANLGEVQRVANILITAIEGRLETPDGGDLLENSQDPFHD